MTVAEKKQEENIAEYILFIWQIEDMLRSLEMDEEALRSYVNAAFHDQESLEEEQVWFLSILRKMKSEKLNENGHIADLNEILVELAYLHQSLIAVYKDNKYTELFQNAEPLLTEYQSKSEVKDKTVPETALHALYGLLLLKLSKAEISDATQEAMDVFKHLVAHLAMQYKKMKNGELTYAMN